MRKALGNIFDVRQFCPSLSQQWRGKRSIFKTKSSSLVLHWEQDCSVVVWLETTIPKILKLQQCLFWKSSLVGDIHLVGIPKILVLQQRTLLVKSRFWDDHCRWKDTNPWKPNKRVCAVFNFIIQTLLLYYYYYYIT